MGVMNMESELVEKGEEVYRKRKEKWERLYLNKIYFRKAGPCAATTYLF